MTFSYLLLSLIVSGTYGFVNQSPAFIRTTRELDSCRSSLCATPDFYDGGALNIQSPLMTILPSILTSVSTGGIVPVDTSVGAEVLTDMAHFSLDFAGLVSPSRSLVRVCAVIGRIFAISADYLPDHSIHTEELLIQLLLISIATKDLIMGKNDTNSEQNI